MIRYKSPREIEKMKEAGQVLAQVLDALEKWVQPGMSTADLDRYAEKMCLRLGGKPAFKGYHGFPASVCVSLNEEVVHGIPRESRKICPGDILSVDFGVVIDDWYADSARSWIVGGKGSSLAEKLVDVTRESLFRGIEQCHVGARLGDVGAAIQKYVESFGFSVVREFVGHGIGQALHEEPAVPNYGRAGEGLLLKEGLVLAIEPMVNVGDAKVKVQEDGWTVVTQDRSLSAHFEHTVAITKEGPVILTVASSEKK